jgi:hypothetical protein
VHPSSQATTPRLRVGGGSGCPWAHTRGHDASSRAPHSSVRRPCWRRWRAGGGDDSRGAAVAAVGAGRTRDRCRPRDRGVAVARGARPARTAAADGNGAPGRAHGRGRPYCATGDPARSCVRTRFEFGLLQPSLLGALLGAPPRYRLGQRSLATRSQLDEPVLPGPNPAFALGHRALVVPGCNGAPLEKVDRGDSAEDSVSHVERMVVLIGI